jgi:hypothetical protein
MLKALLGPHSLPRAQGGRVGRALSPAGGTVWVTGSALICCWIALGCSVGEGSGTVSSDRLFVRDCWQGEFDLRPTFFGANPFRDTMSIRVQRGGQIEDISDGVIVLINDTEFVRENLGARLQLGLPVGVRPTGIPVGALQNGSRVHLTLYLNDTCHLQNVGLHAVDGWIRFDSLFSGNLNEDRSDRRRTRAEFEAVVVDPRDAEPVGTVAAAEFDAGLEGEGVVAGTLGSFEYPAERVSILRGSFEFFFHRGAPAQPFP